MKRKTTFDLSMKEVMYFVADALTDRDNLPPGRWNVTINAGAKGEDLTETSVTFIHEAHGEDAANDTETRARE